jgi:hypothetical protein
VSIASNWWSFTATRYLVDPGLRTHIVPQARNVSLVQVTQNVTNYTYIDNRIVNNGVKVEKVGRACGRTIPRYHVAETDAPEVERGGKVRGQDFVVFRPEPGRGRKSRGRPDSPGQDVRERAHDFRDAREDARNRNRVAPPPQQPPTNEAPPSQAPPATENDQDRNNRDQRNHENRGRKYYDDLMGRQPPPHRSPQRQAPDQSAPPDQQRTTPPPAENRPTNPPPGEQHAPATPPARVEPPQRQTAREKTQEARDAAARGRKPKKDEPKSNENKPDEPKDKKPDSEN